MSEAEADYRKLVELAATAIKASFDGQWEPAYKAHTAHYDRVRERCRTDPAYRKAYLEAFSCPPSPGT